MQHRDFTDLLLCSSLLPYYLGDHIAKHEVLAKLHFYLKAGKLHLSHVFWQGDYKMYFHVIAFI